MTGSSPFASMKWKPRMPEPSTNASAASQTPRLSRCQHALLPVTLSAFAVCAMPSMKLYSAKAGAGTLTMIVNRLDVWLQHLERAAMAAFRRRYPDAQQVKKRAVKESGTSSKLALLRKPSKKPRFPLCIVLSAPMRRSTNSTCLPHPLNTG